MGDKRDTNYDKEQFEIHYFDKGTDLATYDNGSAYDDQPYVFVANEYKDFYEFDSSTWLKNDGTKFDFNTTISENILLKALYRPKPTSFTNYLTEDTKFYLNWKEFKGCTYKLEYGKKGGTLTSVNCGTIHLKSWKILKLDRNMKLIFTQLLKIILLQKLQLKN